MAYQTIFFDLDGTLIDPQNSITKSIQYTLKQFGIHEEIENLSKFIGPPLQTSFQTHYSFTQKQAQQAASYYYEHFQKYGTKEIKRYAGVIELLTKLKAHKKTLCIVTQKNTIITPQILKEQNLDSFFDHIIGVDLQKKPKDKHMLVKEALALYPQNHRESVVMIGDTKYDILGAKANNIDAIGVTYGHGTLEELQESNPTHIANAIDELEQLIS